MEQFADYAYYYNAFYKDKDYKKEVGMVDSLLKIHGNNIKDIIVYGCGTGGHDIELAKLGYRCHGIDLSPQMIDVAKERTKKEKCANTYEVADIRHYRSGKKYDAVVSLFHVMSYQTENDDIINAIKSARSVLKDDGVFLFDVWYGSGVLRDMPNVRIKEVEDEHNRLVRLCRPEIFENRNVVDVNYEIMVIEKQSGNVKTIRETHSMRYYFRPEMEYYLNQCGFRLSGTYDGNTLKQTDWVSWTSFLWPDYNVVVRDYVLNYDVSTVASSCTD